MWNSRFNARSGNPFDNRQGILIPAPEGLTLSHQPHLLAAQAFIPPTERVEAAGFEFPGNNDAIRNEVLRRLNANRNYRELFSRGVSGRSQQARDHVRSRRPCDRRVRVHARHHRRADRSLRARRSQCAERGTEAGRVLFFGRAGCVQCHSVSGRSNEMFSDFREHVTAVPQVAPTFGNVTFDGPGAERGFRARAGDRKPGRSIRVPHLAASQRGAAAGLHAQRRVR
jgi:cytochrome c peroxidase